MATTSDQIQAEIAETRSRMSEKLDHVGWDQPSNPVASITGQVQKRPLLAAGLSVLAGALLWDLLSGNESGSATSATGSTQGHRSDVTDVSGVASDYRLHDAANRVSSTARQAVDATRGAAETVVDTTADAARTVADTTTDVARRAASTVGSAVSQGVDTVSDVASQASERVADTASHVAESARDLGSTIRNQPLLSAGLSLLAGGLVWNLLSGGGTGDRTTSTGSTRDYSGGGYYTGGSDYTGGSTRGYSNDVDFTNQPSTDRLSEDADRVSGAARQAMDATKDAAGAVVDTTKDAAQTAASATVGAAKTAASTTADAARQAASTVGSAVSQGVDTVSDVASQASERVADTASHVVESARDLGSTINRQVYERPLLMAGLAAGVGMLLQPTLAPYVSGVTNSIGRTASDLANSISELVALPEEEQQELERIQQALVPATVERADQFAGREIREYLDNALSDVVGQASLRAGIVAALTEKIEEIVNNKLPVFLNNNLSGMRGLVAVALTGAILEATNQARQGRGQALSNVKDNFAHAAVVASQDQLQRHFTEFRQQYHSRDNGGA